MCLSAGAVGVTARRSSLSQVWYQAGSNTRNTCRPSGGVLPTRGTFGPLKTTRRLPKLGLPRGCSGASRSCSPRGRRACAQHGPCESSPYNHNESSPVLVRACESGGGSQARGAGQAGAPAPDPRAHIDSRGVARRLRAEVGVASEAELLVLALELVIHTRLGEHLVRGRVRVRVRVGVGVGLGLGLGLGLGSGSGSGSGSRLG